MTRQRREDQLAALWALAAKRGVPGDTNRSDCLDANELAAMAEGRCSLDERKRALAHLATCEHCRTDLCTVALTLDTGPAAKRQGGQLFKFRSLTYFGSALALAASIAVFVQIKDRAMEPQALAPAAKTRSTQVKESPARPTSQMQAEKKKEEMPAPAGAPLPERLEEKAPRDKGSPATAVAPPPAPAKMDQTAPPAERQAKAVNEGPKSPRANAQVQDGAAAKAQAPAKKEMSADQALPSTVGLALTATPAGQWLGEVARACQQNSNEPAYWQAMGARGQAILQAEGQPGGSQGDSLKPLRAVVGLIEAIHHQDDALRQCPQIQAILNEKSH